MLGWNTRNVGSCVQRSGTPTWWICAWGQEGPLGFIEAGCDPTSRHSVISINNVREVQKLYHSSTFYELHIVHWVQELKRYSARSSAVIAVVRGSSTTSCTAAILSELIAHIVWKVWSQQYSSNKMPNILSQQHFHRIHTVLYTLDHHCNNK